MLRHKTWWIDVPLALIVFALVVVVYLTAGPHTPLSLDRAGAVSMLALAPEGWAFFSRDPEEARVHAYKLDRNGRPVSVDANDMRGFGLFAGPSRSSRLRGMEIARLATLVPKDAWNKCSGNIEHCQAHTGTPNKVANPMRSGTLCGQIVLFRQKPLTWAWAAQSGQVSLPATISALDVNCARRVKS